jgi:WD40-like Beta Propeller Repeat
MSGATRQAGRLARAGTGRLALSRTLRAAPMGAAHSAERALHIGASRVGIFMWRRTPCGDLCISSNQGWFPGPLQALVCPECRYVRSEPDVNEVDITTKLTGCGSPTFCRPVRISTSGHGIISALAYRAHEEVMEMKAREFLLIVVLSSCGNVESMRDAASGTPPEVPLDAARTCDPAGRFDTPVPVAGLANGRTAQFSPDELTVYFMCVIGGSTTEDICQARRATITDGFGTPSKLGVSSDGAQDFAPTISADELTLIFASDRATNYRLWVATRSSTLADFVAPGLLAGVASTAVTDVDSQPFLTADGEELWFGSNRPGGNGIWHASRAGSGFATPVAVPQLPGEFPVLSYDRLTIYYAAPPSGGGINSQNDIWVAHRSTINDGFPAATPVTELNTTSAEGATWLSRDNCRLYIESNSSGSSYGIYVAVRQP